MTLTAPVELPWSCRSTFPPLGQAINQASKSGVRAMSRHSRRCVAGAPGQRTAGARRLATSWGFTRGRRTEKVGNADVVSWPDGVESRRAGGTMQDKVPVNLTKSIVFKVLLPPSLVGAPGAAMMSSMRALVRPRAASQPPVQPT